MTNATTAAAATRQAPTLNRTLILLGVFTSGDSARALLRTDSGETMMITRDTPENGLTLLDVGDGWAMVRENNRVHRLVIA